MEIIKSNESHKVHKVHKIYKFTNSINGKIYIGQTKQKMKQRFNQHKYGKSVFSKAIFKYGEKSFTCEILASVDTLIEANITEKYYISFFSSFGKGYNMTKGGNGTCGSSVSQSHKNKLSLLKKGVSRDPKTIKKASVTRKLNNSGVGKNNGMYKKGYLISNEKNGRHKKNFKGNIKIVKDNISLALKNSKKNKKGLNPASKIFFVVNKITKKITFIPKGKLLDFCENLNGSHLVLRQSLTKKKYITKGVFKNLKLLENITFKKDFYGNN